MLKRNVTFCFHRYIRMLSGYLYASNGLPAMTWGILKPFDSQGLWKILPDDLANRYSSMSWMKHSCLKSLAPTIGFSEIQVSYFSTLNFSMNDTVIKQYLSSLRKKYETAVARMGSEKDPTILKQSNQTIKELKPIVEQLEKLDDLTKELKDLDTLIEGLHKEEDKELLKLGLEDKEHCLEEKEAVEQCIFHLLVPADEVDTNDIIIEVHAGVGGQEAMLFAKEVFDMYVKYVTRKGWSSEVIEYDETDIGGLRHGILSCSGQGAYRYMKFEGGVHRVQRVPKTEKSGRIHTSTVTVWVLPRPTEIDIHINPEDLIIDTKRASGAGGQHVNKTESCVRITHVPTGMVAESQIHRSQVQNKNIALMMLRTRLYEKKLKEQVDVQQAARKLQVASADRSEKVRTYNFLQDRISDHRINENVYGIEIFMEGSEKLDNLLEKLNKRSQMLKLKQVLQCQSEINT